eukprot:Sdes_comp18496_c0_seq1m8510
MTHLEDCSIDLDPNYLQITAKESDWLQKSRPKKRIYELMKSISTSTRTSQNPPKKQLSFRFLLSPKQYMFHSDPHSSNLKIHSVRFEKTRFLDQSHDVISGPKNETLQNPSQQKVEGTGQFVDIPCDLVLTSVGYQSTPLEGVPFDRDTFTIPNFEGRVIENEQDSMENKLKSLGTLYCSGWVKRGPRGVILNTMHDAIETSETILKDFEETVYSDRRNLDCERGRNWLEKFCTEKEKVFVSYGEWKKIHAEELRRGADLNKSSEKLISIAEMLKIAKS